MSDALFDLSTGDELPHITIDGESYDLALDIEYGELLAIVRLGQRVQELTEHPGDLTEQQEAEMRELLRGGIRRCLKAPDEVLAKLSDAQRFRVLMAFNEQFGRVVNPTQTLIGTSSPDSAGSTADGRKTG